MKRLRKAITKEVRDVRKLPTFTDNVNFYYVLPFFVVVKGAEMAYYSA